MKGHFVLEMSLACGTAVIDPDYHYSIGVKVKGHLVLEMSLAYDTAVVDPDSVICFFFASQASWSDLLQVELNQHHEIVTLILLELLTVSAHTADFSTENREDLKCQPRTKANGSHSRSVERSMAVRVQAGVIYM